MKSLGQFNCDLSNDDHPEDTGGNETRQKKKTTKLLYDELICENFLLDRWIPCLK